MITCTFEDGGIGYLRHAVVDNIVVKNNQILLVKRSPKLSTEPGKWVLPAGYMERDEYLQQAAKREILEETGYTVKNITLLTINHHPNQPGNDRQNICFVFFCEAVKKIGEKDWESSEVKWFDLDTLPDPSEIGFDHLDDIQLYKKYMEKKFQLPFFK